MVCLVLCYSILLNNIKKILVQSPAAFKLGCIVKCRPGVGILLHVDVMNARGRSLDCERDLR